MRLLSAALPGGNGLSPRPRDVMRRDAMDLKVSPGSSALYFARLLLLDALRGCLPPVVFAHYKKKPLAFSV